MSKNSNKILVCPLDWGLGHASRCVPVIRKLLEYDVEVIVAADGNPKSFLQAEFPQLKFIDLRGYHISYNSFGSLGVKMFFTIPKIIFKIIQEHFWLKKTISELGITAVISDSRFGLWSDKVKTVFITHQLRIKSPLFESFLFRINTFFIKKFNACWVPDFLDEHNFSGALSHGFEVPPNAKYVGLLSRFEKSDLLHDKQPLYDLFIIISGPEPQRTYFEKRVLSQLKDSALRAIVLLGKPKENNSFSVGNSLVFSHLDSGRFSSYLSQSKCVLSRSGYSTIMDVAMFGKPCVFVPTPGQTEQEYLADFFYQRGMAIKISQHDFNLENAFKASEQIKPLRAVYEHDFLEQEIKALL